MSFRKAFQSRHRLRSIAMLIVGAYLLSIDLEDIHNFLGYSENPTIEESTEAAFEWMDTTGVTLTSIVGDPTTCKDVIFTGDSRDPFALTGEASSGHKIVNQVWRTMSSIVHLSPALEETCFAFFQVSNPWIDDDGIELHPVWGRLPATALVMSTFTKADIFLYMDSDALMLFSDKTPTTMYNELAFDGYGEDATMQQLTPALIVNKPYTGWLCSQCEKYGIGHGCFNTGALIWNRANAEPVIRAWWESRKMDESHNLHLPDSDDGFHGWNGNAASLVGDKMGEQNRLMYLFATNPTVRENVWPVPRQKQEGSGSESCPNKLKGHTPCLQNDFESNVKWNPTEPSCFLGHYADNKETAIKQARKMEDYVNELRKQS